MGHNGGWDGFFSVIGFVTVIGTPYVDPLFAGFVGLQRSEARLINKNKNCM